MFDLYPFHPEFSTQRMRESDPTRDMVMINGFVVPVSMLPPEIRDELLRRGIL